MKQLFLLALLSIALSGCASKSLTEQQQYQRAQSGMVYKSYKTVSEKTIAGSLKTYEMVSEDDIPAPSENLAHAIAGFGLSMAQYPTLALAEGDLAYETSPKDQGYLGLSVLALAMYQHGWVGLGREYSARARLELDAEQGEQDYQVPRMVAHSMIGVIAVKNGQGELAEQMFQELAAKSGHQWLPVGAHALSIMLDSPLSAPKKTFSIDVARKSDL